jgi:hypothetical protein
MNCRKCGTELPAGAMFCAECGATVTVPRLVEPQTRTRPGDTAIIQPLDLNVSAPAFLEPDFERSPLAAEPVRPTPVPREASAAPVEPAPVEPVARPSASVAAAPAVPDVPPLVTEPPAPARVETTPARRGAPPLIVPPAAALPTPPPAPAPAVRLAPPVSPAAPPAPPAAPIAPASTPQTPAARVPTAHAPTGPVVAPAVSMFESQHDDLEATRIVRNRQGERFVLQFSTGENATVFGSGLIGRNPVMQPGEYVDQLVTIVDSGKSVSKTHLEFGQTAGVFWIVDRFSANGTVVRQPDVRPQRVDPGKRQTIARGTRVDIGEQFFVVS